MSLRDPDEFDPRGAQPSPDWQYEDELPEDMTDAEYDAWVDQSFVPHRVGVRVGPRFVRWAQPSSPLSPDVSDLTAVMRSKSRQLGCVYVQRRTNCREQGAALDEWCRACIYEAASELLSLAAAGGAQPSAAPSEKPPAWSPLERFLLDRQAETRDPRYQDAAVSLYQQRTGWGAPKWPVRVPSAASREIQALREALQRWVDIDNAPDQIAAYLSVLADTKALLSSPANPPDIPDGSSE